VKNTIFVTLNYFKVQTMSSNLKLNKETLKLNQNKNDDRFSIKKKNFRRNDKKL
jgi:hypothetical protein